MPTALHFIRDSIISSSERKLSLLKWVDLLWSAKYERNDFLDGTEPCKSNKGYLFSMALL